MDDLASRVLVLNLPANGAGLGEWLTGAAARGVPFYVTLQQLVAMPVVVRRPVVYVCENPAVLRRAAADLGTRSAPLLCTEGQPSTAFHRLAVAVTGAAANCATTATSTGRASRSQEPSSTHRLGACSRRCDGVLRAGRL